MNNHQARVLLAILLCGSASCRPAQAFFSSQSSLDVVLQTADWQPATTNLTLNSQRVVDDADQLTSDWVNCDTLQSQAIELLESGDCVQRNFSFAANQERSLSFLYQLSASELLESVNEPLVLFLWRGAEIAWLSQTTDLSQWLTIGIPGSEQNGVLSIEVSTEQSMENAVQIQFNQITSSRLLLSLTDNLSLSTDDPIATIFVSREAGVQPISAVGHLNLSAQELIDLESLTYWSVDAWGNTESPKHISFQVINQQAPKPEIFWHSTHGNRLYVVVRTEPNHTVGLIRGYQLVADSVLEGRLEQPNIMALQVLHEFGTLVGLSFPLSSGIHAARLHSVSQVGITSLASDIITF